VSVQTDKKPIEALHNDQMEVLGTLTGIGAVLKEGKTEMGQKRMKNGYFSYPYN
jgi:hypothetical protein